MVILSQYDDPDYAVALLAEGSAGYAYLLKDRIAEGDQLARAIREVATGGSMLDPVIVSALINPVRRTGGLSTDDDELLRDDRQRSHDQGDRRARSTPRHPQSTIEWSGCSSTSPKACRAARPGPSTGCDACTGRSSNARSRARA